MGVTSKPPQNGSSGGKPEYESALAAWLSQLGGAGEIGQLLEPAHEDRVARGYGHTLREICQQPVTWRETAAALARDPAPLRETLAASGGQTADGSVVVTGSGSSLHAAECVAFPLQEALGLPVSAVSAGQLLTHPQASLPPRGALTVVSLARSGNSPESQAVVDLVRARAPHARHLFITCNPKGELATAYSGVKAVRTILLDERTHDRSLVMTSSFTNLVLAGYALGELGCLASYEDRAERAAAGAERVLKEAADALASAARSAFRAVVYLGSGCRLGAAREAALKMLEMTEGRIWTRAEPYLGLRHGPMSAVHEDTLVVAFLSSSPVVRRYELDLLRGLESKELGLRRVVVGANVPPEAAPGADDVVVECGAGGDLSDPDLVLLDALVGQLLGFFSCRDLGLRPDSPSTDGVITRVVEPFEIHDHPDGCRPQDQT